jgi:hypothetical protein
MTLRTLHQYKPLAKFHVDPHFIYITMRRDESKEELQSYYKLTDEDTEQIMKEWSAEFLVPVDSIELSDPNIIERPLFTQFEHTGKKSAKKNKKKEEFQNIYNDEEDNASKESRMLSLKFRPHRATRTPHHQHRKTVIHGTRINSTAQKKGQNYTKLAKKFKSASRPWKTRACAPYLRTSGAYARLWGAKPARLPNGAFMKLVGLPTTNGSAPKSI